jgi:endonuclease/exonuclease/phosphatase family metal-dependent hydrolase
MSALPPTPGPEGGSPQPATLLLASCNTLNLASAGRSFYANQDPYGADEYMRKVDWLGGMLRRLNADVVAVQEVWDEAALRAVVAASGLRYPHVVAPGTDQGAQGTPRVGLVTRWPVLEVRSHGEFGEREVVAVPELGAHRAFERPVLEALIDMPGARGTMRVLIVHLKSKRPKFLQDAAGNVIEDRDDPAVQARASLRALVMRAAECAALRLLVHARLARTREPMVLMGDLNDGPQAVTTQIVAATQAVAYDRAARDTALFHACDVQSDAAIRRDVAYSHLHQGWPEVLDQIWVSEEFVGASRFAIGDVRRVEFFNDHLNEGRDRTRSDHGFVRALVQLR